MTGKATKEVHGIVRIGSGIDVDDGMSVVSVFPDKKIIGVKYLENKDDFEYIGKPADLYF